METEIKKKSLIKGYIFIILTAFMYSTQELAGKKLALFKLDPYQVIFWAFFVAMVLMAGPAFRDIKKKKIKLKVDDFKYFALTGILCVPLSMASLQMALNYTNAATVAVIISANAVFTMPFAYLILKERMSGKMKIGMLLSILGLIVIVDPRNIIAGNSNPNNILGICIALFAAITFSLYSVYTKKRISRYGGFIANFWSFLIGDIVLFIYLLLSGRPIISNIKTIEAVALIIVMGFLVKFLGYVFYLGAIKETSAIIASTVFMIKPVLGPILAVTLLGEVLHFNFWIGVVLVIGGSIIIFRDKLHLDEKIELNENKSSTSV